jgi:hypothetical protein
MNGKDRSEEVLKINKGLVNLIKVFQNISHPDVNLGGEVSAIENGYELILHFIIKDKKKSLSFKAINENGLYRFDYDILN